MNPSLLTHFHEHQCPAWACPACHAESLAILPGSFHWKPIPASVEHWQNTDADPEEIELVFSCLLKCDLGRCSTFVAASGSGYVTETPWDEREEGDSAHMELFQARSFTPALSAFRIPAQCPEPVAGPLRQSFSVFLSAPGAAATAIRIALEALMTALGVPQNGTLANRIRTLPEQYREYQAALTAMRLLGNAGSHELDRVTRPDVEQAYVIIEFLLKKIYAGSTESVHRLTERLAARFRD